MQVKAYTPGAMNARNLSSDKELIRAWSLVRVEGGEILEPIVVRWWMGRSRSASVVYCSVWVHGVRLGGDRIDAGGHGRAGGYGYCKQSAAFEAACESAGFKFSAGVGGVGDSAVEAAIRAIADHAGWSGPMAIIRHS